MGFKMTPRPGYVFDGADWVPILGVPTPRQIQPTVNLPLDSLTGWTIDNSGTWTIDSGQIQIACNGADTDRFLRLDGRFGVSMAVVEVELKVISSAGGAARGSIGIGAPGGNVGGFPLVHYMTNDSGTTWVVSMDRALQAQQAQSAALAGHTGYGTWRKMRVIFVGDSLDVYMDGVHVMNAFCTNATGSDPRYLVLNGRNATVQFRNLKAWHGPSLVESLVAGTNGVTGGSGLSGLYTPRTPPVWADEFNDGLLDPAYVRADNPAHVSYVNWTEGSDVLSQYHSAGVDTLPQMHALLRPIGAAWAVGDALVTAGRFLGAYATAYTMWGPCLTNGTVWGTSDLVHAQVYTNTSNAGPGLLRTNAHTDMTGDSGAGGTQMNPTNGPLWLRLVMTAANTWRSDASPDGVSWWIGPQISYTMTPTHMGFAVSNWSTAMQSVVSYEFLRRYSGVA